MSGAARLLLGCLLFSQFAGLSAAERLPDVRMLIDVSGSMRESDPQNLREPALELMLRLLPEGSRAGIWTFGERVEAPVRHRAVDREWREDAARAVRRINNRALLTNIPEALQAATFDADRLDHNYRVSLILLTDGKVDISEQPELNRRAARDILQRRAIALRDLGIQVHTIALSDNADWVFLRELARATGGLAEKADSPEALSAVFLQAMDIVAPTEQVPLLGGEFLVDDSVTEFTVLAFPEDSDAPLSLRRPDGEVLAESGPEAGAAWHRGRGFALASVERPMPGIWRVQGESAIARVNVLANLSLRVDGLDTSMPSGRQPEIGIRLEDSGGRVRDPDLLALLQVDVVVARADGERWRVPVAGEDAPEGGEFRLPLPMLAEAGRYEITVTVDGGSFQREQVLVSEVFDSAGRPPAESAPRLRPGASPAWLWPAVIAGALVLALLLWWVAAGGKGKRRRRG